MFTHFGKVYARWTAVALLAGALTAAAPSAQGAPAAITAVAPAAVGAAASARSAGLPNCNVRQVPFVPQSIDIYGVRANVPVLAIPRSRRTGVPGTPPLNDWGKGVIAWASTDAKPGSFYGNVLLNAHTWPDGSALGNDLLARLYTGQLIVVSGQGRHLCYRVTKRVIYNPSGKKMTKQYYAWRTRSQLALVVCSGKRLGPSKWTKRTVWYASPSLG